MSLEQRLSRAMRDAAARLDLDPARAYERFTRRRRRLTLAAPALAVTALVAVLAATVAVVQFQERTSTPAVPAPQPTPSPSTDLLTPPPQGSVPGPGTVEMPAAGFAIDVPAGWGVEEWPGDSNLALRPEEQAPGGVITDLGVIIIETAAVKPELGPGRGEVYPETLSFPMIELRSVSSDDTLRRPDGRRVFKSESQIPTGVEVRYAVTWPYYCAAEEDCPVDTKLRTLMVTAFLPETASPEVRPLAESIAVNARPITNALEGGDQPASREGCGESLRTDSEQSQTADGAVRYEVAVRNWQVVACDARSELLLRVIPNRHGDLQPAEVVQIPPAVVLEGVSPEEVARPAQPTTVTWRWTNWCGEPTAELEHVLNGVGELSTEPDRPAPPPCTDPDEPSTIELLSIEE